MVSKTLMAVVALAMLASTTQATYMMEQLRELIKMRNDGDIDADEFKAMKAALIRE